MGISKLTWVKRFMDLDEDDQIIKALTSLGTISIPLQTEENLPEIVKSLESFTCKGYGDLSEAPDIPALHWKLFRTKNLVGENLPPTRSALLQHILRVNYVCTRDKSYTLNLPALPDITENGWKIVSNKYIPIMTTELPAPKAVLELVKCGCNKGCTSMQCSCKKNDLPCTPLCKCYYDECINRENSTESDDEEENDT